MTSTASSKPSPQPWTPHGYQNKAVEFLLSKPHAALFLDPGLGKTSITLAAIAKLKAEGKLRKALIIAPLRVCYTVWPEEVKKWQDFSDLKVAVLHGPKKDKALASDADIYVINPEGLEWLFGVRKSKLPSGKTNVVVDSRHVAKLGFDTLVVDELSKFKNATANRFKALKAVLSSFERRWGLTGSPAANGLMDIFGQAYVIDQGEAFGQYITQFKFRYFNQDYTGYNWTLKPGAELEIYAKLNKFALRMAATDYLDMPELIESNVIVDLPKPAMKIYTAMENDLIADIEADKLVASNAAVAAGKCRQICSGAVYSAALPSSTLQPLAKRVDTHDWLEIHDAKLQALEDLIDELQGAPLLVAYEYAHELSRIRARLGNVPYIGAGVSAKATDDIVARWNRGEIPVLLGHPASMGHGLNLQNAGHHVAFFTPPWSLEHYTQFIGRVWRQGNTAEHCIVYHIIARDTIDEIVVKVLRSKNAIQSKLFDALKNMAAARAK